MTNKERQILEAKIMEMQASIKKSEELSGMPSTSDTRSLAMYDIIGILKFKLERNSTDIIDGLYLSQSFARDLYNEKVKIFEQIIRGLENNERKMPIM